MAKAWLWGIDVSQCDIPALCKALHMANKVDFLDGEERVQYACAVHSAMMWGRYIDCENNKLQKKGVR